MWLIFAKNSHTNIFFSFFLSRFFSRTFTNHRTAKGGDTISFSSHYDFHPLHRHLGNSQKISVQSSPLYKASEPGRERETLNFRAKAVCIRVPKFLCFLWRNKYKSFFSSLHKYVSMVIMETIFYQIQMLTTEIHNGKDRWRVRKYEVQRIVQAPKSWLLLFLDHVSKEI